MMLHDVESIAPRGGLGRAAASGALVGVGLMLLLFLAYLAAPDLPLAGTIVLAVLLAVALAAALLAFGPKADRAGPVEGAVTAPALSNHSPNPDQVLIEELEAKAARLREEGSALDRATHNEQWLEIMFARGETLQQLARRRIATGESLPRKMALGNFRLAASSFRHVTELKGRPLPGIRAARARLAAGECLLTLGGIEGSREHLEQAARDFVSALEQPLDDADRERAEGGLASAEEQLTELSRSAEIDLAARDAARDDFF